MQARQTRDAILRPLATALCLTSVCLATTLMLAGCGTGSPKPARPRDCGTSHTAANIPIEVEVSRGQVSCSTALIIQANYAKAIVEGKAPGNGGGGPVSVNGWTCQGYPTPELLKTGAASKCAKDGMEIVAILKTS